MSLLFQHTLLDEPLGNLHGIQRCTLFNLIRECTRFRIAVKVIGIIIQHFLIECNYQNEYVDKSAENRNHVLKGHAELKTTLGIIKDNSDSLRTVILCHLSDKNSNPEECVAEVKKVVKNNVLVDYARKGLEVELNNNNCPF